MVSGARQPAARGYPRNRLTDRPADEAPVTRRAMSRGHAISFEESGAGEPIVLIPGATMSAADWRDAGYVDLLAADYRVLCVDPLGLGRSDKPHDLDAYAWPAVATDILAVLDECEIDRAALWGYSRGGSLACGLAIEAPERVAALIVHDQAPSNLVKGSSPSAYVQALLQGDFGPMWEAFEFSAADRAHDEAVNDPRALGALWAGPRRSGLEIDVGRIVAPVLVVGGDDDPAGVTQFAAALGVEAHLLPRLDHLQAFERTDLVVPLVLRFLEGLER